MKTLLDLSGINRWRHHRRIKRLLDLASQAQATTIIEHTPVILFGGEHVKEWVVKVESPAHNFSAVSRSEALPSAIEGATLMVERSLPRTERRQR